MCLPEQLHKSLRPYVTSDGEPDLLKYERHGRGQFCDLGMEESLPIMKKTNEMKRQLLD